MDGSSGGHKKPVTNTQDTAGKSQSSAWKAVGNSSSIGAPKTREGTGVQQSLSRVLNLPSSTRHVVKGSTPSEANSSGVKGKTIDVANIPLPTQATTSSPPSKSSVTTASVRTPAPLPAAKSQPLTEKSKVSSVKVEQKGLQKPGAPKSVSSTSPSLAVRTSTAAAVRLLSAASNSGTCSQPNKSLGENTQAPTPKEKSVKVVEATEASSEGDKPAGTNTVTGNTVPLSQPSEGLSSLVSYSSSSAEASASEDNCEDDQNSNLPSLADEPVTSAENKSQSVDHPKLEGAKSSLRQKQEKVVNPKELLMKVKDAADGIRSSTTEKQQPQVMPAVSSGAGVTNTNTSEKKQPLRKPETTPDANVTPSSTDEKKLSQVGSVSTPGSSVSHSSTSEKLVSPPGTNVTSSNTAEKKQPQVMPVSTADANVVHSSTSEKKQPQVKPNVSTAEKSHPQNVPEGAVTQKKTPQTSEKDNTAEQDQKDPKQSADRQHDKNNKLGVSQTNTAESQGKQTPGAGVCAAAVKGTSEAAVLPSKPPHQLTVDRAKDDKHKTSTAPSMKAAAPSVKAGETSTLPAKIVEDSSLQREEKHKILSSETKSKESSEKTFSLPKPTSEVTVCQRDKQTENSSTKNLIPKETSKTAGVKASSDSTQVTESNKVAIKTPAIGASPGHSQGLEGNKVNNKTAGVGAPPDNIQLSKGNEETRKTSVVGTLPSNTQVLEGNRMTITKTIIGASTGTAQISEGNKATSKTPGIKTLPSDTQLCVGNKVTNVTTGVKTTPGGNQVSEANKVTCKMTSVGASPGNGQISEGGKMTSRITGGRVSSGDTQVSENSKVSCKTSVGATPSNTQVSEHSKDTCKETGEGTTPKNTQVSELNKQLHNKSEYQQKVAKDQTDESKSPAFLTSSSQVPVIIKETENLHEVKMNIQGQQNRSIEQGKKRALEGSSQGLVGSQNVEEPIVKKSRVEENSDSSSSLDGLKKNIEMAGQAEEPEPQKMEVEMQEEKVSFTKVAVTRKMDAQGDRLDEGSRDGVDDNGTEEGQEKENSDGKEKDDVREEDEVSTPSKRRKKKKKSYERPRGEGGKFMKERPDPSVLDEDTRMDYNLPQDEDSQGSSKREVRRFRCEVIVPESTEVFTADKVVEYMWPLEGLGEHYFIQEQISQYLGIMSFKRRYPDMRRRPIDMQERDFLKEKGLVSEMACDLGLTAVRSEDVLDVMFNDFPSKFEELQRLLRERKENEIRERGKVNYSLANIDKSKMQEYGRKAAEDASRWNANFNKEKRDERRYSFDLQTFTLQMPSSRGKKLPAQITKIGYYPVSVLPGQYTDYYRQYTPSALKTMPLNSIVATPVVQELGSDGASSDSEEECPRSGAGEGGIDVKEEKTSEGLPRCKVCSSTKNRNKDGKPEPLIFCGTCRSASHPTCIDLTLVMVPKIESYNWQCMDCKTCVTCNDPDDEEKMIFCDMCDRGYHIYCVGLRRVPNGRWHCKECAICSSCGSKSPAGSEHLKNAEWQHEFKKDKDNKQLRYATTLCVPCDKYWKRRQFCYVCLKVYRSIPEDGMVRCSNCPKYIHREVCSTMYENERFCINCFRMRNSTALNHSRIIAAAKKKMASGY